MRVYNCIKSSEHTTNALIICDVFLNAHKIVCVYYLTEILAERSVKNSKKFEVVKCTLRKKPTKKP